MEAERKNDGKIRYDLIPVEWEEQLATLLTEGARKYADHNWKGSLGTPKSKEWREKCIASLRRHLASWQKGEMFDPEHQREVHHMTAVAWNALAIMWYDMNERKLLEKTACSDTK